MEFQVGDVVCSKAGRDEGTFLVVVGIEGGYLYCATESRGRLNGQSEKIRCIWHGPTAISICKRWKPIVHYAGRCAT